MSVTDLCVACSRDPSGALVVRVGVPLADVYLEFLGGLSRPNTVLAAASDLKVFFALVVSRRIRSGPAMCWRSSLPSARAGGSGR